MHFSLKPLSNLFAFFLTIDLVPLLLSLARNIALETEMITESDTRRKGAGDEDCN